MEHRLPFYGPAFAPATQQWCNEGETDYQGRKTDLDSAIKNAFENESTSAVLFTQS